MKTPFNNNTLILIILASILCINYNAFVAAADKKVTRNLTTTQTKQTAVITSVIVIDAFGKQISPPNSSWDGRAQIIVKGENLTVIYSLFY